MTQGVDGPLGLVLGLVFGVALGFLLGRRSASAPAPRPEPQAEAGEAPRPAPAPVPVAAPHLQAFDAAVEEAGRAGWAPSLPPAVTLAQDLAEGDEGARRFVQALEAAARRGIASRDDVFVRQLGVARLWRAAADLARTQGLELAIDAPRAVGPQHQERWICDEDLARRVGSWSDTAFVQPMLVLRPALLRDGHVLLEGVVV